MLTLLAMEMLGMDDLEGVPVGYEEMDDEALNIKFRKLCHDIVMKVCKSFGLYIYTYMVLKLLQCIIYMHTQLLPGSPLIGTEWLTSWWLQMP